jgi:hypothetical protein
LAVWKADQVITIIARLPVWPGQATALLLPFSIKDKTANRLGRPSHDQPVRFEARRSEAICGLVKTLSVRTPDHHAHSSRSATEPARLVRHAGTPILRLPPGHGLLAEVLARLRALPAIP